MLLITPPPSCRHVLRFALPPIFRAALPSADTLFALFFIAATLIFDAIEAIAAFAIISAAAAYADVIAAMLLFAAAFMLIFDTLPLFRLDAQRAAGSADFH
jgi:hypothetical protein